MWRFQKIRKIKKKLFFSAKKKSLAEKHVFLNPNSWRYEIFVKTKKFCRDVTISKKKEKSKNTLFFGLEKLLAEKHVFLNPNR